MTHLRLPNRDWKDFWSKLQKWSKIHIFITIRELSTRTRLMAKLTNYGRYRKCKTRFQLLRLRALKWDTLSYPAMISVWDMVWYILIIDWQADFKNVSHYCTAKTYCTLGQRSLFESTRCTPCTCWRSWRAWLPWCRRWWASGLSASRIID